MKNAQSGSIAHVAAVLAARSIIVFTAAAAWAQSGSEPAASGGSVMRGWRIFHEKRCVDCHAIWGQGGHLGPDLGRLRAGRLTEGQLAGVMWNHIPKMLGQMRETGRPPVTLTEAEMDDLFALLFFVRQLDEQGDPLRGEEILRAKGCSSCHETDASGASVGPDLAKWTQYANPIMWAQLMWEHAPMMEEAMKRNNITWPKLDGADLVHIVAYVRSSGVTGEKTYLRPGSVDVGKRLFREKQCGACHPGLGPDLATTDLPPSVGSLASRMWNHSPSMMRVMRERDVARQPLAPQELADIITYILALGYVDRGGDVGRGQQVFATKGCVQCHEPSDVSAAGGPPVAQLGAMATPVRMASAMWNHGEAMLERMTEAGLAWPVFSNNETVDLLAYLRTLTAEAPSADKVP